MQSSGEPRVLCVCIKWKVHFAVHHIVEKLSILRILHHHEDVVLSLNDLVELSDGRMPD